MSGLSGIARDVTPTGREAITLRLPASTFMPRKLVIRWDNLCGVVLMFGPHGAPELGSASAMHEQCQLESNFARSASVARWPGERVSPRI